MLPINRALPFLIDPKDGEEIGPCALARAQKNGWMWGIPAQSRIDTGRMERPWIGNCLAMGLASSFLAPPLEATSIHGTVVQFILCGECLGTPEGRDRYNAAFARQVDDFRDLVRNGCRNMPRAPGGAGQPRAGAGQP